MYYQDKQNEAKERVDSIRHDKDEEIHKLRDDMDAMRRDFQRQMRDKVHTHTHTHTHTQATSLHLQGRYHAHARMSYRLREVSCM